MAEKPPREHSTPASTEAASSLAHVWYTDPLLDNEAYAAALRGAAAYSLGYLPTLVVSGKDRATWLNGLLTCDVSVVRSGVAAWGLLLDRVGKVQAVLGVVAHGETFLVAVLWGDAREVHHQLDMRLVMEDAELEVADDWHWTVGIGAQTAGPEGSAWGSLELAGRCTLIAEPSFSEFGSRHALSDAAWALWRLSHALPWGGVDFDAAARPHEAALDRKAVSWSKGCYLGQEVVCMQDMRGKVKKRLAVFTAVGEAHAAATLGASVRRAGETVGKVTSAVYEPDHRRWTLFALVPTAALPEPSDGSASLVRTAEQRKPAWGATETELEWEVVATEGLTLNYVA